MFNGHKPKLVFFRWDLPNRAAYIRMHLDQQVKCLSQFFAVTVVNGNCDYQRVCDIYQPEITLFESGVYVDGERREIANVSANPQIPKIGFFNADAMCASRSTIIADMAKWGIETFFTLSVSMPEYTPAIAEQLYVWPNAIDAEVYHDYGEHKNIPVLVTGSLAPHYPWRNRVSRRLAQYYPAMTCPHFGWGTESDTSRMIRGEQYARLLNASWFVPSCGTVANDIVRKHFEIPGSRTCLITEKTAAVDSSGFLDWQNCIFADEHDVLDKVDYLFSHPDDLERIIAAGHDLVHSRHTIKQRDQLFQWFVLWKELGPQQRIVQRGPFEALTIADVRSGSQSSYVVGNGLDRVLLQAGDGELWAGRYDAAQRFYTRALNYLFHLPEAKLRLALCSLYRGEPDVAKRWLDELVNASLVSYGAAEPDPVEWAYFLITHLCRGDLAGAGRLAEQFPDLRHPELDRTRQLIHRLRQQEPMGHTEDGVVQQRPSVHQLPTRTYDDWIENTCMMLRACDQAHIADRCTGSSIAHLSRQTESEKERGRHDDRIPRRQSELERADRGKTARIVAVAKWLVRPFRGQLLKALNRLERSWRYFLPYRLSAMRTDELFGCVETLARDPGTETILVLGAAPGSGSTEACLAGARDNPSGPTVFCVPVPGVQEEKLQRRDPGSADVKFCEQSVDAIMKTHQIDTFGMVVIAGGETVNSEMHQTIREAGVIVLDDLVAYSKTRIHQTLAQDNTYTLLLHNPRHRSGGYAIFRNNHWIPGCR